LHNVRDCCVNGLGSFRARFTWAFILLRLPVARDCFKNLNRTEAGVSGFGEMEGIALMSGTRLAAGSQKSVFF